MDDVEIEMGECGLDGLRYENIEEIEKLGFDKYLCPVDYE